MARNPNKCSLGINGGEGRGGKMNKKKYPGESKERRVCEGKIFAIQWLLSKREKTLGCKN